MMFPNKGSLKLAIQCIYFGNIDCFLLDQLFFYHMISNYYGLSIRYNKATYPNAPLLIGLMISKSYIPVGYKAEN